MFKATSFLLLIAFTLLLMLRIPFSVMDAFLYVGGMISATLYGVLEWSDKLYQRKNGKK